MDVRMLKNDITRKLTAYGYAYVNGPVLRQTLRPSPSDLEAAGRMLVSGEPNWVAEPDPVGDRIVIRERGGVA